jgi:hypothetical protein
MTGAQFKAMLRQTKSLNAEGVTALKLDEDKSVTRGDALAAMMQLRP